VPKFLQEKSRVAISAENLSYLPSYRTTEPPQRTRLQQLIDTGAVYVAQNLSHSQFATLQAIAARISKRRNPKRLAAQLDAALNTSPSRAIPSAPPLPPAFDCTLGLDELDTLTRVRTGYPFAELPTDLQEAVLSLVASRDLTTRKLDLALWLEEFRNKAASTL
jgi:hypothetical protein